jgi:Glucose-6-phosphate 1-dehydrogenase
MSERLFGFLDEVMQRHFGPGFGSYPQMRRVDVEKLLTDDTQRRVVLARLAAVEWGSTEIIGTVEITSDRLVITPRGLLYAAGLAASVWAAPPRTVPRFRHKPTGAARTSAGTRRILYYLATPPALFEPFIDQVGATQLLEGSAVAVDRRFGHELEFPWPLDVALRKMLDAHEAWRLDLTGRHRTASPAGTRQR